MTADVTIVGGGAAGLMCAIEAGKRGRTVVVLERNPVVAEKIRISGGGRCNFTNLLADHSNYLSQNPHFCKSAMSRFTTADMIALVRKHGIRYHEKKLGQLFCDTSSTEIIDLLRKECSLAGVTVMTGCEISDVTREEGFRITSNLERVESASLVIATGGLSIPQMGATNFGYRIARQFGLNVTPLTPGLVPLVVSSPDFERFKELAGVSIDVTAKCGGHEFREHMLFTHRGMSGPAILQISSYWTEGESVVLDLLPDHPGEELLNHYRNTNTEVAAILGTVLPRRFCDLWLSFHGGSRSVNRYSRKQVSELANQLHGWSIVPAGSEGFGKAEVTVGGVDTMGLSSKTMEARDVPGLYFVGEVVDVTGWLGGYNFQWAWSSGWVAGQYC